MTKMFLSCLVGVCIAGMASVAQAQSADETLTFSGTGVVVPARSWNITAETSNRIKKLHFIQGQFVHEGDLLVEFHTGWKQLELDRAEASLAVADAKLNAALDDLSRLEELKSRDVTSTAAYNDARFAAESARAEHQVRTVEHAMAKALLGSQSLYAPLDGQISKPRFGENGPVTF